MRRAPLDTILPRCYATGATERDWEQAYLATRFEVLSRVNADVNNPGNEAKKHWDALMMPATDDRNAIVAAQAKINTGWKWMRRTGKFTDEAHSIQELMDNMDTVNQDVLLIGMVVHTQK